MVSNTERVHKHRQLKGNQKYKDKYTILRKKYTIKSSQADKMKYWSNKKIHLWLVENGYEVFDLLGETND